MLCHCLSQLHSFQREICYHSYFFLSLYIWVLFLLVLSFIYLFIYFRSTQFIYVPRLVVESEQQLLATTTATQDPNHVYDLHHSSWQHRILNPLNKARNQTWVLIVTSLICFCCAMTGNPLAAFKMLFFYHWFWAVWLLSSLV